VHENAREGDDDEKYREHGAADSLSMLHQSCSCEFSGLIIWK
jgi:hypothetical protein